MSDAPAPRLTVLSVVRAVADEWRIGEREILSERRGRQVAEARHVAIWLARDLLPHSLPRIGRAMRRDHSTVLYALGKVDRLLGADTALAARVAAVRQRIAEAHGGRTA